MGATNCPETPRQKMITMMYLVYTAMLALNVSAEVVEGFRTVSTAMTRSNINMQAKLDDTFSNFENAYNNSPAKVKDKWEKAQQVRELTKDLAYTIDTIEYKFIAKLISEAEVVEDTATKKTRKIPFINKETGQVDLDSVRYAVENFGFGWMQKGLDNTNDVQPFFIGAKGESEEAEEGTVAYTLKHMILDYEHKVKEILGADSTHITFGFNVDKKQWSSHEKKDLSWEMLNFREAVAGAALVALIRLKGEAMNAEFDAVNQLYGQVSKGDFKFDKVALISRPKSTYIHKGGVYETYINVGAYDTKERFSANVNGQQLTANDSGAVIYRTVCNATGPQTVRVTAKIKNPDGEMVDAVLTDNFYVAEPMGVISLDNLQVLYAGVDNPITASVPGADARNVRVEVAQGQASITKVSDGKFTVRPTMPKGEKKAGRLSLKIYVKQDKGELDAGSLEFRVKPLPDPVLVVGGKQNGAIVKKTELASNSQLVAVKAPGFDFALPPRSTQIAHVKVTVGKRPMERDAATSFDAEIVKAIKGLNTGDKVYVEADVRMSDGELHKANCVLTIK